MIEEKWTLPQTILKLFENMPDETRYVTQENEIFYLKNSKRKLYELPINARFNVNYGHNSFIITF
jgi:hypothetical protein